MGPLAPYQIYFLTIGLLLILLIRAFADKEPHFIQYRLFQAMVVCVLLCTVIELVTLAFDGRAEPGSLLVGRLSSMLLFVFNIAPLLLWILYIDSQIHQSRLRMRKAAFVLGAVFAANALVSVSSLRFGFYFYYDAANVYRRGPLFWLASALYFGLLLYVLVMPIVKRAALPALLRWPLVFFSVPSVIGVVAQILWYGLNLTWAGAARSLLVIYTSIQNRILSTDYLTGLYNRRQLDTFLFSRVKNIHPGGKLAVMMMDIDKFKKINDELGHQIGDLALERAAALLRKTFHHHDFIARYAGDEFAVVFDYSRIEDIESIKSRLMAKVAQFNASGEQPFALSVSVGFAVYDPETCSAPADLLNRADAEMYAAKRAKTRSGEEGFGAGR